MLCGDDQLLVGLDDARLLTCDGGDRVAQIRHVVEVNRRDHRDRRVDDVRRIEPATQPDLDDGDIDRSIRERSERHRRYGLEERQADVACAVGQVEETCDLVVGVDEAGWR